MTEDSTYWDKEIDKYLPEYLINRGVIEAAYNGSPMHQRILGLSFLPYSRDHAMTWLTKAAKKNDREAIFALQEMANVDSPEVLIIWWSFRDFTNTFGSRTISVFNRVTDTSFNKYVYRNAIIIPFLNDVSKLSPNYSLFDYIRDNIDQYIIDNTEIIYTLLNDEENEENDDDDIIDLISEADNEENEDGDLSNSDVSYDDDILRMISEAENEECENLDFSSTIEAMKAKLKNKK